MTYPIDYCCNCGAYTEIVTTDEDWMICQDCIDDEFQVSDEFGYFDMDDLREELDF